MSAYVSGVQGPLAINAGASYYYASLQDLNYPGTSAGGYYTWSGGSVAGSSTTWDFVNVMYPGFGQAVSNVSYGSTCTSQPGSQTLGTGDVMSWYNDGYGNITVTIN